MNKIKMIALDMDGTVLTDTKEITEYTKTVLEKAMQEGIIVLACTGRPATAIPEVFSELEGIKYAISSNGARILNVEDNEIIYEKMLSVKETKGVIKIMEKYDTYREVFLKGQGYTTRVLLKNVGKYFTEYMEAYISRTRIMVDDLLREVEDRNIPCDKVHIAFSSVEERSQAISELKLLGSFEYKGALPNNMEVTAPGISKGTGIIKLGEILGINREEIMAVGDSMNDESMLREVGFPVAMGNADLELKKIAKYITATNNEDGVAKAIEKFAL